MTDSTRFIARVLGPFLIIFGLSVALKADDIPLIVPAFFQDGVLVLITGTFTLAIGLIIVAAHHRWDGLAPFIITIFGIVTTIRGAALLLAPDFLSKFAAELVRVPGFIFIPAAVAVVIGLYLSFVGWITKQGTP